MFGEKDVDCSEDKHGGPGKNRPLPTLRDVRVVIEDGESLYDVADQIGIDSYDTLPRDGRKPAWDESGP